MPEKLALDNLDVRIFAQLFGVRWYHQEKSKEARYSKMKGYYTDNGYMGYINGSYRLFADESDYRECLDD